MGMEAVVMVGVKMDAPSRELLTWAMVKVAQPGDTVIALHVLDRNDIVDRDGKSSLLSLVKAFNSVLAVYEGFCNLKQVDLKLKICRGSSIRKVLVREAKSFAAAKVILGAASNKIRLSTSVAKYCAKKLPKDCSVLAVSNGKVVFHREGCPTKPVDLQVVAVTQEHRRNSLLNVFKRSISLHKSSNGFGSKQNQNGEQNFCQLLTKAHSIGSKDSAKKRCSVCVAPQPDISRNTCENSGEDSHGGDDQSLALVPVSRAKGPSSSISLVIKELPELKPGWPLLRRMYFPNCPGKSSRDISVVQWAMRLPSRPMSEKTQNGYGENDKSQPELDGKSGAIVPVSMDTVVTPSPPRHSSEDLPKELEGLHEKYSATCRLFEYQELVSATSDFVAENLIGKGGSSQVYKGCLPDGKELAVKILKQSEDVLKEFILEIEIITTLHHKNIISLLGFCYEKKNLLLVYDLLSRGSLEENLYGDKKDSAAFGWNERYKVALGVAEALEYLHDCSSQPVIHRDVKSSNILLSDDFEPQLSDFGLAKWASTSSHIICTDVAGTFGYLAPEYFMYGKVNDKIDVYSFGVVLLELLSGRKPISNDQPKGQESLVMWAKPILDSGKVSQLLDPSLGYEYEQDLMERMVLAAKLCTRRTPGARPRMNLVVKLLRGDHEATKWAQLQLSDTEDSDSLDDEASSRSDLQSHLNLALLDLEDESLSMSSTEQSVSLEDYLKGRWSRSWSFD